EALGKIGMTLKGARVAVQGFGNVGSVAADLMAKEGAVIVGVSDKSGALYRAKGLDVPDVLTWVREHRQLAGYPQADAIPKDQLLTLDCDVLVPAATENVITRKNAPQIKAKVICEGANGPTTAAADEILEKKGIFVIPDILANAGGVTVSYFEWVQDRGGYFWDEDTVNRRLESIMTRSFHEVMALVEKHKVSTRIACYMLAVDRVAAWTAGWEMDGRDVAFAIGGAEGVPEPVLGRAERVWSLSRLTFPHELARLLVYEQLYRAYTIRRGEPYHRGS